MSVETFIHRGYTINIEVDEDPQNPREDDNLTVMACFHKRYQLGDKHNFKANDYGSTDELLAAIIKAEDPAVILPLYLYEHSGITMKTTPFDCRWDSGQVGFIWITKKAALDNWSWKRLNKARLQQIKDYILADVKVYDDFISGAVYGYTIKNPDGEEIEASCWGFYGFDSIKEDGHAIVEAKAEIDADIEDKEDPRQLQLKLEGVA